MDKIFINTLPLNIIIGTLPAERERRQRVVVDIAVDTDLSRAGADDDLSATIDYAALEERVVQLAAGSSFFLIEALAEAVAALVLAEPLAAGVRVKVSKPAASRRAREVAVEIYRSKE